MNKTVLTGALSLALGIGIGVLINPGKSGNVGASQPAGAVSGNGPSTKSTPADSSGSRLSSSRPAKSERRPASPAPDGFDPDEPRKQDEDAAMLAAIQNGQDTAFAHLKRAHQAQFESLSTLLGLTDDQRNQLQSLYYDPLIEQMSLWNTRGDQSTVSPSLPPDLGEALGNVLDPDQVETYNAHRADSQRRRAQATALRQVADLAFLDLTPDQRDAAYDALYDEGRTTNPNSPLTRARGAWNFQRVYTVNTGIVSGNSADRGAVVAIVEPTSSVTVSGYPPSPYSPLAQRAREVFIERDAARLQDILTPEQLTSYREHLTRLHDPSGIQFPANQQLPPLKQ